MKFLIIHNRYSRPGGEEGVVALQRQLLESRGHTVLLYERSYDEIRTWRFGRLTSLFSALYNRRSVLDIREIVRREQPDAAIVHNLFPVISPAILPELRKARVRVLMTLHNYRLVCPTGLFHTVGAICERCGGCAGREWNCLIHRCEGSLAGSLGYALRGWWSRRMGYFSRNVDRFLALTAFQRDRLSHYTGIPVERFAVVPNCIDPAAMPAPTSQPQGATPYIAYAGRLSREKGINLLFEAARLLPGIEFRIAGQAAEDYILPPTPANVTLLGQLDKPQLADLYAGACAVVTASRWYEGFPLSVIEAMYYGAPVVVPALAGLPEIVADGTCGAIYPAGSATALADTLRRLVDHPDQAAALGQKGRERVQKFYNPDLYCRLLIENAEQMTHSGTKSAV